MNRVTDVLTREEIRGLVQASNVQGALSVLYSWGLIFGAMGLVALWPNPLTVLTALVIIGGRQLGLAILTHETAHYSLFASKSLNQWAGKWVLGAPVWLHLDPYRQHHIGHHTKTGTDDDPDKGLVTPFPTTRASLMRKVGRDLLGISAIKRFAGLAMMDAGMLRFTASVDPEPLPRQALWVHARQLIQTAAPVAITNGVLLAVLLVLGHPLLYLLWLGAWFTTYGLFVRIRSIAEHACTERTTHSLRNTRTTQANWLAQLTVAPHNVNYHLEHHLLMTVPHYNLHRMHKMLRERGVFDEQNSAPGYLHVLRIATSTPT